MSAAFPDPQDLRTAIRLSCYGKYAACVVVSPFGPYLLAARGAPVDEMGADEKKVQAFIDDCVTAYEIALRRCDLSTPETVAAFLERLGVWYVIYPNARLTAFYANRQLMAK